MGFCDNCKIENEQGKSNCPLCGKCVDDNAEKKNNFYPQYNLVHDRRVPVVKVLERLLLLGVALCLVVNLLFEKTVSWSLYVTIGAFLAWVLIIRPIKKIYSPAQILTSQVFWLTGFMLFLELYTQTWGWGVMYAIPCMWIGYGVVAGIMSIVSGYVNFEMFKPMFMILFLSVISLILLLCFDCPVMWPTVVAFLLSVSEIVFMFMFRFKMSLRSLKKDFGI